MPARPIAVRQRSKDRRWREDVDSHAAGARLAHIVTLRGPTQQSIAAKRVQCSVKLHESGVRQHIDRAAMQSLPSSSEALAMQHKIHLVRVRSHRQPFGLAPRLGEGFRVLAAALETGPVSGSERCWLIKEKQFGVVTTPDVALAALEIEHAADPLPRCPPPRRQRLGVGMKTPAAIAEQRPARR